MNDINLFERVSFNPILKTYIFVYVAFVLFCTIIGIPLMIIWLCGFGQWYSRHYYEKLECEFKERALRFQKGIILNIEKTIPLENIQDLTFIEGPLLRKFNLSILKVETAGQSKDNSNEMKLIGIVDAHLFRDKVLEQRRKIIEKRFGQNNETQINNNVAFEEMNETLKRIEQLLKK